ncbi:uncharacterized protein LOC125837642 [Solanum verrucosum]|uniref:uncharacterized protein LOC125837642 n=1 Tax=Solanum verrucosum TaxID=315347 RepID=UPI0020D0DEB0|nr:uncharacterized protein LOC125837642 [Solanum verrucosum]
MGVTLVEKAELATYQLKGVSQTWYNKWKGGRPEDAAPLDWEKFKANFLDRFLPLDMRAVKVLEFINLRQESLSIREYALKFTQLSNYAPIMIADSRARMTEKLKENSREGKRAKSGNGNFSHAWFDGHGRSRFRQSFSGQGFSNAPPKFKKDRVSDPKPQGGNGNGSSFRMSTCAKCGNKHKGKCLAVTDGWFNCG